MVLRNCGTSADLVANVLWLTIPFLVDTDINVEQVPNRLFFNGTHHCLEEIVAFFLVFNKRITLGHCPQSDPFL